MVNHTTRLLLLLLSTSVSSSCSKPADDAAPADEAKEDGRLATMATRVCACKTQACVDAIYSPLDRVPRAMSPAEAVTARDCELALAGKGRSEASFYAELRHNNSDLLDSSVWTVRYLYEDHDWVFAQGELTVDDSKQGRVESFADRILISSGESKDVVDVLWGESTFLVDPVGPHGLFKGDRYVASIGGVVLTLGPSGCTAYAFNGESAGAFLRHGTPASCRIESRGDDRFFVYDSVKNDFAEEVSAGELQAVGGILVNSPKDLARRKDDPGNP